MKKNSPEAIPVIDLFAGPGGLGEGFSALGNNGPEFKIVLSIEMDDAAHSTLELRSFFREFPHQEAPDDYYAHLRGELSRGDLFARFPSEAEIASELAWQAELGKVDTAEVDRKIRKAVGTRGHWVLCGGPPCQAYSVIGRSRNGGIARGDHRVYLYREYLRILAVHTPPVFIMENVPGLLSSTVGKKAIFEQMLDDLRQPAAALADRPNGSTRYFLAFSGSAAGAM